MTIGTMMPGKVFKRRFWFIRDERDNTTWVYDTVTGDVMFVTMG